MTKYAILPIKCTECKKLIFLAHYIESRSYSTELGYSKLKRRCLDCMIKINQKLSGRSDEYKRTIN